MGSRANYVLVDRDGWRLYYSHWGAQTVDRDLAAGPDAAIRFIEAQQPVDRESGWIDDTWGEGGALVDATRRVLIFFGDGLMHVLGVRRAYFALLARTWPGWRVRWAFDGLADLVRHVGGDVAVVRVAGRDPEDEEVSSLELRPDAGAQWSLVTVRTAAGVTVRPILSRPWPDLHPVGVGPTVLDVLDALGPGARAVEGEPPRHGLHLDVPARTVGWWAVDRDRQLPALLPSRWPGWTVEFWGDAYERQQALCGDVPTPGIDALGGVDALAGYLDVVPPDPVRSFRSLVERFAADDQEVEVNPATEAHTIVPAQPRDTSRLDQALADVRRALTAR